MVFTINVILTINYCTLFCQLSGKVKSSLCLVQYHTIKAAVEV